MQTTLKGEVIFIFTQLITLNSQGGRAMTADRLKELLALKDKLIKEYHAAIKKGINDSSLYQKIMDVNRQIRQFNRWRLD